MTMECVLSCREEDTSLFMSVLHWEICVFFNRKSLMRMAPLKEQCPKVLNDRVALLEVV